MEINDIGINDTLQNRPKDIANILSYKRIILISLLILGVIVGSLLSVHLELFGDIWYSPKIFSGLPIPENGLLNCLASYLSNTFLSLTIVLMLGVTVFGMAAIPAYVVFKGILIAVRVISLFQSEEISAVVRHSVTYAPFLALTSFILVLFASEAMGLSFRLMKERQRSELQNTDMKNLIKNYFISLFFTVLASLLCLTLVLLYTLVN